MSLLLSTPLTSYMDAFQNTFPHHSILLPRTIPFVFTFQWKFSSRKWCLSPTCNFQTVLRQFETFPLPLCVHKVCTARIDRGATWDVPVEATCESIVAKIATYWQWRAGIVDGTHYCLHMFLCHMKEFEAKEILEVLFCPSESFLYVDTIAQKTKPFFEQEHWGFRWGYSQGPEQASQLNSVKVP